MSDSSPRRSRLYDLASRFGGNRHVSDSSSTGGYNNNNNEYGSHSPSPYPPGTPSDLGMGGDYSPTLESLAPPQLPFAARERRSSNSSLGSNKTPGSSRRQSFASLRPGGGSEKERPKSLSVNYVPAKFTKLHAPGEWTHRRAKQGGGRDAFAGDASRMGAVGTVDDDEGVVFEVRKNGGLKRKNKPKLRWNRFKWTLFVANTVLLLYGMGALIVAILVWLNVFYASDVIRVGNREELIVSTVAAGLTVLTSLLGFSGIILNNRSFLAVYTVILWACLALIVAPGYMTYKQRTFNLEGKINAQWSRTLGSAGRLRIQDALRCCGYYNPFIEAVLSPLCYPRSIQPGCKGRYLKLERQVLETWYICSFGIVPIHILIILAGLLCSNHITYRFGKGLTPKRYRLDLSSMAVIMDGYVNQIAAQYGPEVAAEAKARSSVEYSRSSSPFLTPSSATSTSSSFPALTKVQSRLAAPIPAGTTARGGYPSDSHELSTYNSSFAPGSDLHPGPPPLRGGSPLFDPRRDSFDSRRDSFVGSFNTLRREERYDVDTPTDLDSLDGRDYRSGGGGGGGSRGGSGEDYLPSGPSSQMDHDRNEQDEMGDSHGAYDGPASRWAGNGAHQQATGPGPSSRNSIGWAK